MNEAIPVVVNNLTPTFYSVCVLIVITLTVAIKQWAPLDKQKKDSDASLRADLMKMLTDERTGHAAEMAAIRQEMQDERRRCDEDLHALRQQVEGLQRMIIQFSTSSGRAIELGKVPEAAKSVARVEDFIAKRGDE
jgi:uncharacterized protein HemX